MRVLLVDDEQLAIDRLRAFFADIDGVEVVGEARDGNEAVDQIRALTPDLVIMDIQMPGRTGLEAADYLLKPVRFDRLRQAVDRARRRRAQRASMTRAEQLEAEVAALREGAAGPAPGDDGFWVPERHGQRRVAIETIDWI